MKKVAVVALIGAALAFPLAAQADGSYIGLNVGRGEQTVSTSGVSLKDTATSYKLSVGYIINPMFALDLAYTDFGTVTEAVTGASVSSKPQSLALAVTGTLPLNEQFGLFAKAGVSENRTKGTTTIGTLSSEVTNNHASAVLGLGATYWFTKEVAVVAEYEYFDKLVDETNLGLKANVISLGLRYKF